MVIPQYAKTHLFSRSTLKVNQDMVKAKARKLLLELDKLTFTLKPKYDKEIKNIHEIINQDFVELTNYYILCINELTKDTNPEIQEFITQLDDLEEVVTLYYQYKSTKKVHYRNILLKVITPYMEVMKLVILKCDKLFENKGLSEYFGQTEENDASDLL